MARWRPEAATDRLRRRRTCRRERGSLRVTDLIVYARGASNCLVTFGGKTAEIFVPTGTMVTITFASGPTYGPGEQVVLGNNARITGGGNNGVMTWTVMGYTFRPN